MAAFELYGRLHVGLRKVLLGAKLAETPAGRDYRRAMRDRMRAGLVC